MTFDFDREWPFFPDDEKLRIFDPRANVAILIGHSEIRSAGGDLKADPPLATILQALPSSIPPSSIAAIGTIATLRDGVERVVQNLLTNPYITVVFLCGRDSPVFYPLEGLACLHRYGVDDGRHVVAGNGAPDRAVKVFGRDALATLSHEDIAAFRRRELEIVDCRGAVDPVAFFADVAARLGVHRRRVEAPAWGALDEIDVYRWRPRTLQVPAGTLERDASLDVSASGATVVIQAVDGAAVSQAPAIAGTGKPDGRAQRALHTVLQSERLSRETGWESRLAELALRVERAVLAAEFPDDVRRIEKTEWLGSSEGLITATEGRPLPLDLDPTGFFKIRVLYEQALLAADYHAADGRHVETLQAKRAEDLLAAIVGGSYVGEYPGRDQHIVYLGVQIARADFALRTGLRFEEGQPLAADARKNVDHHLSAGAVITGGSLEETWVAGLASLRDGGLLTSTQKGRVAEGWCTFFLVPAMGAMTIPAAYPASDEHVARYADELLAPAPEVRAQGAYTYGDRTCHYFFDQIAETGRRLAADPGRVYVNQRWVPELDLVATAHHRPCLVFDLWLVHRGRLHTLQVARSHDVYGGLPQNALGIARGWGRALAGASGLPLGDLCFLSISNNYRIGDDAENVRKAIQRGVHAPSSAATIPPPPVTVVDAEPLGDDRDRPAWLAAAVGGAGHDPADAPIAAVLVRQLRAGAPSAADVLAPVPPLAERLLAYKGRLDQVRTVIDRLRAEVAAGGRDHSNSLLLSPRDPEADRDSEATPLVCFQVRRQLGLLHGASVVVGDEGVRLAPLLFDLQRAIAAAAGLPVGSALIARARV